MCYNADGERNEEKSQNNHIVNTDYCAFEFCFCSAWFSCVRKNKRRLGSAEMGAERRRGFHRQRYWLRRKLFNNLIWVLGYSHNGTNYGESLERWYPGGRYCDVVGADSYEVSENGAESRLFNPVRKVVGDSKPLAMHETGLIPSVNQFKAVPWVWFMTWHTTYITNDNPIERLNEVYNSEYVITLDELKDIY
ncbi:MAG: hypothetical protein IJR70_07345 [Eubacterium sp.]|nr:hypothetical protein [Eubacterium sp.]